MPPRQTRHPQNGALQAAESTEKPLADKFEHFRPVANAFDSSALLLASAGGSLIRIWPDWQFLSAIV